MKSLRRTEENTPWKTMRQAVSS